MTGCRMFESERPERRSGRERLQNPEKCLNSRGRNAAPTRDEQVEPFITAHLGFRRVSGAFSV